jgi:hypothetical protein
VPTSREKMDLRQSISSIGHRLIPGDDATPSFVQRPSTLLPTPTTPLPILYRGSDLHLLIDQSELNLRGILAAAASERMYPICLRGQPLHTLLIGDERAAATATERTHWLNILWSTGVVPIMDNHDSLSSSPDSAPMIWLNDFVASVRLQVFQSLSQLIGNDGSTPLDPSEQVSWIMISAVILPSDDDLLAQFVTSSASSEDWPLIVRNGVIASMMTATTVPTSSSRLVPSSTSGVGGVSPHRYVLPFTVAEWTRFSKYVWSTISSCQWIPQFGIRQACGRYWLPHSMELHVA